MFTAVTSLLLILVALALLGGAHFLVHGVARHFAARALGVRGTRLVLEIGDREAYAASPRWRRILAAAAGPVANYLLCAFCFLMAALLSGREESTLTLQRVMKGSPAEAAGLRGGDRVVAVDGRPITAFEQIGEAVRARGAGE